MDIENFFIKQDDHYFLFLKIEKCSDNFNYLYRYYCVKVNKEKNIFLRYLVEKYESRFDSDSHVYFNLGHNLSKKQSGDKYVEYDPKFTIDIGMLPIVLLEDVTFWGFDLVKDKFYNEVLMPSQNILEILE